MTRSPSSRPAIERVIGGGRSHQVKFEATPQSVSYFKQLEKDGDRVTSLTTQVPPHAPRALEDKFALFERPDQLRMDLIIDVQRTLTQSLGERCLVCNFTLDVELNDIFQLQFLFSQWQIWSFQSPLFEATSSSSNSVGHFLKGDR